MDKSTRDAIFDIIKNMKKKACLFLAVILVTLCGVPNFEVQASEVLAPFTQLNSLASNASVYTYTSSRPLINATEVLAYTNVERYRRGLPLLSTSGLLGEVAQIKMKDLFAREYFEHESPTGESVSDLADNVGYKYIVVGENLALGDFDSSKGVVEAWMNSEGHKKNILSKAFSEIGIAAGKGNYKGRNTWIVVQSFGNPRSSCPSIDSELANTIDVLKKKLEIYVSIAELRKEQVLLATGTSLELRQARVDSYNRVVKLYNATADEYTKIVDKYNSEVGDYNDCLKTTVGRLN